MPDSDAAPHLLFLAAAKIGAKTHAYSFLFIIWRFPLNAV